MKKWTESKACQSRAFCQQCRKDEKFRQKIVANGQMPERDFVCPWGADDGLGTWLEKVFKPIAKALKMKCLDEQGKLKPKSKCAERRDKLNALTS